MGERKKKRQSVARFVASARELVEKHPNRFELVRLTSDGRFEECSLDEPLSRAGSYELRETKDNGEVETFADCLNETEEKDDRKDAETERMRIVAKETERLSDKYSLLFANMQTDRSWLWDRFKEQDKQIIDLRAELTKKEEQMADMFLSQNESGDEWVRLFDKGIDAFTGYQFFGELKKRLNRLLPNLTREQASLIEQALNNPAFTASEAAFKELEAASSGTEPS